MYLCTSDKQKEKLNNNFWGQLEYAHLEYGLSGENPNAHIPYVPLLFFIFVYQR